MNYDLRPGQPKGQFRIYNSEFIILFLTLVCLLLPTRNSTLDAWYYAACVRHEHELLLPHHLLYNPAGLLWTRLLSGLGLSLDTLAALKMLNALAAGASLWVLLRILRQLKQPEPMVMAWVLVVGASFGMMRFATENEAYVLPVLFSLLGSLCWTRYQVAALPRPALLVWAGLGAAGACLFHQIHFFWWLGLLLGTAWTAEKKRRDILLYTLPALLVPAAYVAALPVWHEPFTLPALWRFVFHDYYAGLAGGSVSVQGGLLTVVNLGRTFLQVHGSLPALLRAVPLLAVVPLLCAFLFGWAGLTGWRAFRARAATPAADLTRPVELAAVGHTHGLILLAQLAFAAYAAGNAEFMVMVPALVAIAFSQLRWVPARSLTALGGGLLLWNLAFGLGPAHFLRFTNTDKLLTAIPAQPQAWFLLDNHNLVLNQLHYRTGNPVNPANVWPAPTLLVQRAGQSPARFRAWVRGQQRAGHRLFTDCLGGPKLLDRAQIVYGDQNAALLQPFRTVRIDSFATFSGPRYLTEILPPIATPE
ncbi:hypothetical protein GCM10022408_22770 [Hymenobacter fastidiosus]|uniref:Glycosyltransferase RgtA/B/C/D-like domain-containing protein n=1 Tax=Hymenobacter fastidiosus TaxID=486264 RepID=A0ABP7SCV7_9BACT